MNSIVRGVLAGTVATALMTIPVVTAQRLGLFTQPPPMAISEEVARKTPLLPTPTTQGFCVAWVLAHVAYGATGGALYGLGRRWLPASWPVAGLVYGGAVWVGSYAGYLPLLDLYPSPRDDRPARVVTMLLAHAIYGITIAAMMDTTEPSLNTDRSLTGPTFEF